MRKSIILVLVAFTAISGCKKENEVIKQPTPSMSETNYTELEWVDCFDNFNFTLNQQDKEELLTFEHDAMQEATVRAADYVSQALVQVLENDPNVINHIYSFMQNKYGHDSVPEFLFEDFCQVYPTDCDIINNYLLQIMPSGTGSLSEIDAMMAWDENYFPGILIVNYANTNFDLAPIITPGIDINDELYGFTEDATYAYYKSDIASNVEEIVFDLPTILEIDCTRPILVTTHMAKTDSIFLPPSPQGPCSLCGNSNPGKKFSYYEFKIKTRHERWGSSEVLTHYGNTKGHYPYNLHFGVTGNFKVGKSQINQTLTSWVEVMKHNPSYNLNLPISKCNSAFNVAELDDWQSQKRMLTIVVNGNVKYSTCARKWTSDWFAFDPYNTEYDYYCHLHQWSTNWVNSSNGAFNIWRID